MNSISDYELIQSYDGKISEKYNQAKRLYQSAPIQTLILLRAIATTLAGDLLQEFQHTIDKKDLFYLLDDLQKSNCVNQLIIDDLHNIRMSGNKAAHPDVYSENEQDLINLARTTLLTLCNTVDLIKASVHGASPAQYRFEEPTSIALQEASYQALFNNDPEAKFEVARSLIEGNILRVNHELSTSGQTYIDEHDHLRNAVYLLESPSNHRHLDSRFTLGIIYQQGLGCKPDLTKASAHMSFCANQGNVMAMAYFGLFIMEMEDADVEEKKYALEYLEEAAKMRNPLAQNVLSEIYSTGELVNKNQKRSIELLTEAATGGYPESQCKLAELHLKSGDINKYWELINKALHNNYALAFLSAARTSASSKNSHQAMEYYARFLELKDDAIAQFEFAKLKLESAGEDVLKIKDGIWKLVVSYRDNSCPVTIKRKIEKITPKYLSKLDKLIDIQTMNTKSQKDLMVFYTQFKANGVPYESNETVIKLISKLSHELTDMPNKQKGKSIQGHFYQPKRFQDNSVKSLANTNKIKIGRNKPCICNSGLKFKQCCGK